MVISEDTYARARRRLARLERHQLAQLHQGLPVVGAAEQNTRAAAWCRARKVAPETAQAAFRAAEAGLPHHVTLAWVWVRGLLQALAS